MYGDTLYGERLHVLSSMVQSNCLGERAPPSLALVIWCCSKYGDLLINMYSLHRLSAILQVEYGGIDMMQDPMENFNCCASITLQTKARVGLPQVGSCWLECMCGSRDSTRVVRLINSTST